MKSKSFWVARVAALTVAVFLLFLVRRPGRAQEPRATPAGAQTAELTKNIYLASIYAEDRSLGTYAGQKLWNTAGAELGELKDFLVHVPTGRVEYAVVSSGGVLGMGNSLRLVPIAALQQTAEPDRHFAVNLSHARWLQMPSVSDEDYVADRFRFSPSLRREANERYGVQVSSNAEIAVPAQDAAGDAFSGLVRASTLRGKTVRAAGRAVGKIENIVIELERGTAAALVHTDDSFTGTDARYLVPLPRLAIDRPNREPLETELSRADFDRAQFSNYGMPGGSKAVSLQAKQEKSLAPTGRSNSDSGSASAPSPALDASVRAVRQVIQNDPSFSVEKVQVSADDNKVVLRGSVRNQIVKGQLEGAARSAITPGMLDSRLTVDQR